VGWTWLKCKLKDFLLQGMPSFPILLCPFSVHSNQREIYSPRSNLPFIYQAQITKQRNQDPCFVETWLLYNRHDCNRFKIFTSEFMHLYRQMEIIFIQRLWQFMYPFATLDGRETCLHLPTLFSIVDQLEH